METAFYTVPECHISPKLPEERITFLHEIYRIHERPGHGRVGLATSFVDRDRAATYGTGRTPRRRSSSRRWPCNSGMSSRRSAIRRGLSRISSPYIGQRFLPSVQIRVHTGRNGRSSQSSHLDVGHPDITVELKSFRCHMVGWGSPPGVPRPARSPPPRMGRSRQDSCPAPRSPTWSH